MKINFLLFLIIAILQNAQAIDINNSNEQEVRLLYISQEPLQPQIYTNQIFPLTLKILVAKEEYLNLYYKFKDTDSCKVLSKDYKRERSNLTLFDTFLIECNQTQALSPVFDITLIDKNYNVIQSAVLDSKPIRTIKLNPDNKFANLYANEVNLINYQSTNFNNKQNLVLFELETKISNIKDFKINGYEKQEFDFYDDDNQSLNYKFNYSVWVPKSEESIRFKYFNQLTHKYQSIIIPIIVIDDSVTTQTDLAPVEKHFNFFKYALLTFAILVLMFFFFHRKKIIYLVLVLFVVASSINDFLPYRKVCIKPNTQIKVLPMEKGSIFLITKTKTYAQEINNIEDYTKIKLGNEKIGWINNENICKN